MTGDEDQEAEGFEGADDPDSGDRKVPEPTYDTKYDEKTREMDEVLKEDDADSLSL